MKLTYIANIRIPTERAHGIQIMKMCEAFSRQGMSVNLVVPRRLNSIKEDPFVYYGVNKIFNITKLPTIDLIRFGRVGFWIQALSFSVASTLYVLFSKIDVVYSRDELSLIFISFFKKEVFWEVHMNRFNLLNKMVLKNVKGIIAITNGLKNFYIKKGFDPHRILVAHDGVDMRDFDIKLNKRDLRQKLHLPADKKIMSYVGRYKTMGVSKGVEAIIECFVDLVKDSENVFLLIVGLDRGEVIEVEKMIKDFGIESKNYSLVGHVPRMEALLYIKASDILIMNYPYNEHYAHYMSPMKLFEYMASGNPIISSDLPSIREVLDENTAIFVEPDKKEALLNGLVKILKNPILASTLAKNSYLRVLNYTWEKRASKILSFSKK